MTKRSTSTTNAAASIAALTPACVGQSTIALESGRMVQIDRLPEEQIRIIGQNGQVELAIELTQTGPRLRFSAADIAIASPGKVAVECDRFEVTTTNDIQLKSGGDLKTEVDGRHQVTVKKAFELLADTLELVAEHGDATMKANDIVRMLGERIYLNSEETPEDKKDKIVEFLKHMRIHRE